MNLKSHGVKSFFTWSKLRQIIPVITGLCENRGLEEESTQHIVWSSPSYNLKRFSIYTRRQPNKICGSKWNWTNEDFEIFGKILSLLSVEIMVVYKGPKLYNLIQSVPFKIRYYFFFKSLGILLNLLSEYLTHISHMCNEFSNCKSAGGNNHAPKRYTFILSLSPELVLLLPMPYIPTSWRQVKIVFVSKPDSEAKSLKSISYQSRTKLFRDSGLFEAPAQTSEISDVF